MHPGKRWIISKPQWEQQKELVDEFGLSPLIAQVLINRGITEAADVKDFLNPTLARLAPPQAIPNMDQAVEEVFQAKAAGEKVLVFGDYDVDGITGTAVLVSVLASLEIAVDYYIPDRMEEGYGLNEAAVNWAVQQGYKLMVTVDCGISAVAEVAMANELGIKVVITDHHQLPEQLPNAAAIINPKLGQDSRCGQLAGVGVAFKLAQALLSENLHRGGEILPLEEVLDLVTLGTVADMVPLLGDNRVIVKNGLERLVHSTRPGIQALINVSGLAGKDIGSGQVSFALAPRINAIGRLGNASLGVELLLTTSMQRAEELAKMLDHENSERQSIERQILDEALDMIEAEVDLDKERVIVLASPLWHSGVVGIVASKIVEKFYRPAVMIALEGDMGKASARSIAGFDLFAALEQCSPNLQRYGGHAAAAGASIKKENIQEFRREINDLADQWLDATQLIPALNVDGEMLLAQVTDALVNQLADLKPHGLGNPGPLFCCRAVNLIDWRQVGNERQHAKMMLASGTAQFQAIGFNIQAGQFKDCNAVDVAFVPDKNYWQGKVTLQLQAKDIRPAAIVPEVSITALSTEFDDLIKGVAQMSPGVTVSVGCAGFVSWAALAAAVNIAAKQPVALVCQLASQSRQLYNAGPLFASGLQFLLANDMHGADGNQLACGEVLLLSQPAYQHLAASLPQNTAVVLLNLQNKDIIGINERNSFAFTLTDAANERQFKQEKLPNGKDKITMLGGGVKGAANDFHDGSKGVIFTALPSDTEKVAAYLRGRIPGEIVCYNERLTLEEKLFVLDGFYKGVYQVIVATHGMPLLFDFGLLVVLLDPPFNYQDLLQMLPRTGQLRCRFEEKAWPRQLRLLEQLFLHRRVVEAVYIALRKDRKTNNAQLIKVLAAQGISPALTKDALTTLADMGLVKEDSGAWTVLNSVGKADPTKNWRYVEGENEFLAFERIRKEYLQELVQGQQ